MSSPPFLTFIAPGAGAALVRPPMTTPALSRLAGKGAVVQQWMRGEPGVSLLAWQRGLLESLDVPASNASSAAFSVAGESPHYWLHAEPVHFVAGLDRLTFLPLVAEARVTPEERVALFASLSPGFSSGSFVLTASESEWYLRCDRPLQLTTSTPEAAAANELQLAMPGGSDAALLRRAMTEMQMLLHEHPVNEARARRGLPAINAIWLWGGGIRASVARTLPPAFGSNAFLRGVYSAAHQTVAPLPHDPDTLLAAIEKQQRAVVVVDDLDAESLDNDWLAGLVRGLSQGRLSRLELILDSWRVTATRRDLLRFWRRDLPPDRWEQRA